MWYALITSEASVLCTVYVQAHSWPDIRPTIEMTTVPGCNFNCFLIIFLISAASGNVHLRAFFSISAAGWNICDCSRMWQEKQLSTYLYATNSVSFVILSFLSWRTCLTLPLILSLIGFLALMRILLPSSVIPLSLTLWVQLMLLWLHRSKGRFTSAVTSFMRCTCTAGSLTALFLQWPTSLSFFVYGGEFCRISATALHGIVVCIIILQHVLLGICNVALWWVFISPFLLLN